MANVLDLLDRDWAQLVLRAGPRSPWPAEPALAVWSGLDKVLAFVHEREHPHDSDVVLAALARRAASDALAARTLLQALTPALRRITRRLGVRGERGEVAAIVVAVAWERIRTYPIARRPSRIAANVTRDTHRLALAALVAGNGYCDAVWVDTPSGDGIDPTAIASVPDASEREIDLAVLLDDALNGGIVSGREAELIEATRIHGRGLPELARQQGEPYDRLRQRRRRAEQRLARWATSGET